MMAQPIDTTPLLADAGGQDTIKANVSECKLQDKCFLADGAAQSSEGYKKVQRKLVIACILCFIFMIVEVVGGYFAKSVAIMSDAAHMLSDVSAFLVSIFATWAATQPSTWHYSFGYHRAEILGALVSVLTIWAVTGALVFEAFQRTINPVRVDGKLMFIISVAGVVFNIMIALTLGVHAHLGHSHGPDGGCSHSHSHGNDDHDHDHGHSHSKGGCSHNHSHQPHGEDSKHSHNHAACESSKGKQGHAHSHSSGSEGCGNSHEGQHHQEEQEHKHEGSSSSQGHGNHPHSHSHSHSSSNGCCGHKLEEQHHHSSDSEDSHSHDGDVPAVAAAAVGKECVVINLPASTADELGGPCGLSGHALTCRCTIRKTGSREIEVRCELPITALPAAAAGGGGAKHSHGGADHGSLNLRGAVLHVIGDLLQSIGVAIAGGLIWLHQDDPRWYLADPICTFVFSIVVLLTTKSILRDIVHVLMERTPHNMDIPAMSQVMMGMDGIKDVHDLHIWNISTSMKPVLTAHVHIGPDADANIVLQKLEEYVRGLGIDHSTIQICNIQPAETQLDV